MKASEVRDWAAAGLVLFMGYLLMVFFVGAFVHHLGGGSWIEGGLANLLHHYEWFKTGEFPSGHFS